MSQDVSEFHRNSKYRWNCTAIPVDPSGNQAGANMYAYCGNIIWNQIPETGGKSEIFLRDPINHRDPSGMDWTDMLNKVDGGGCSGGYGIDMDGQRWEYTDDGEKQVVTDEELKLRQRKKAIRKWMEEEAEKSYYKIDLFEEFPEYETMGTLIKFTWSGPKAIRWCNYFQDAASACAAAGSPDVIAGCLLAIGAGALPFCLCGYFGNGLTVIVDYVLTRINYISCNLDIDYSFQDIIEDTTQPTPIVP